MRRSQHGEDQWIIDNLPLPAHGTFVEVGVGRPCEGSGSIHFEDIGWNVILIEANPDLHHEIERTRKGKLFGCAAGNWNGTTRFVVKEEATHSGILRDVVRPADGNPWRGTKDREITVPINTLDSLLSVASVEKIDILSIDTEGTELDVWDGLDVNRYKPSVVIMEWNTTGLPDNSERMVKVMARSGYKPAHKTGGNFIFVPGAVSSSCRGPNENRIGISSDHFHHNFDSIVRGPQARHGADRGASGF